MDYNLISSDYESVSPGFLLRYETPDVAYGAIEEGFLELGSVKGVTMTPCDAATPVTRRHGLPDDADRSCLRLHYGTCLSDNRCESYLIAKTHFKRYDSVYFCSMIHCVNVSQLEHAHATSENIFGIFLIHMIFCQVVALYVYVYCKTHLLASTVKAQIHL